MSNWEAERALDKALLSRVKNFHDFVKDADTHDKLWDFIQKYGEHYNWTTLYYRHKAATGGFNSEKSRYYLRGPEAAVNVLQNLFANEVMAPIWVHVTEPIPVLKYIEMSAEMGHDPYRDQYDVIEAYFKKAWTFPVFGSKLRSGYVMLDMKSEGTPDNVDQIHWIMQQAHWAHCRILDENQEKKIQLSQKEILILREISRGKTNGEIGEILSISPHTVNGYLRKIYIKTNTNDRTTAVLRAIAEGVVR